MTSNELDKLRSIRIHTILGLANGDRRVSIRCCFHNDRTPSLVLYPDNSYHCFACGENGQNVIDFLIATGASFTEVIEELKKYE